LLLQLEHHRPRFLDRHSVDDEGERHHYLVEIAFGLPPRVEERQRRLGHGERPVGSCNQANNIAHLPRGAFDRDGRPPAIVASAKELVELISGPD
jgi:hypothetical protein